jgi:hypothetical protein
MIAVAHPRALICTLVAIAMTFASVASAWAVSANIGRSFPQQQQQQTRMSHDMAMPDCERMAHASKADTPDGKQESCADNFCMAKCFKVFASLQSDEPAVTMALTPHPFPLRFPAIWIDQPPFAPPRS